MRTIDWLHYDALYAVISAHGFMSAPLDGGGLVFRHPGGARLMFPAVERDEPVYRLHYGATHTVMTNYGIMTGDAFDLALLQAAHRDRSENLSPLPTRV